MTDYVRNNKTKRILTVGIAVLMVFSLLVPLITDPSYAADTWRADKNDRRVCCFTEWSQILQG